MSWALVLTAPPDQLEVMAAELFDLGALGVELQEPGMPLMPGTPELPPGRGRAIAHFASRPDPLFGGDVFEVADQDWSTAWRAHHATMRVGPRSWIHPPWEVAVTIDPGMAFGTGSHPTTSLCLERCDELLSERPGAHVLDIGTGSGVIALLAVRLGAGRVVGTENDPVALQAARENAALNGVSSVDWMLADPADVPGEFGMVIANILLNTLEELAPQIADKVAPGGRLVLSGLLAAQGDAVETAYTAHGLRPVGRKEREGWIRVELERP
ncbi:MAG: 50S ribosomal protein L11 methyltransferase [Myxococcales bacterium]|nr:50S ribosomal protein L11 methyltransferase [Myxococcales bacterium]